MAGGAFTALDPLGLVIFVAILAAPGISIVVHPFAVALTLAGSRIRQSFAKRGRS
jgi:Cu/Ag efflux pump CusA